MAYYSSLEQARMPVGCNRGAAFRCISGYTLGLLSVCHAPGYAYVELIEHQSGAMVARVSIWSDAGRGGGQSPH